MYARDFALIATPIGMVRLHGGNDWLDAITIERDVQPEVAGTGALAEGAAQISAYFARRLTVFDLPLSPLATPRGTAMREAMVAIGFGETRSYGTLARSIGSGARAIGQACARNPLPIVVPCHRVTNADGSLGAYSAGQGTATKRWLLDHEQGRLI
ncbi:methylated-DNA--[protein]-cysteine S-methyltransferase [Sphingomonas sp. H39-1-10]|uniref:methylated-DNA--[protein]-cysteine S-methyltransferase n=1 Tax=Sphingomonas TaxID=13687 RepID=UPI000886C17B|nr:MULTISPECIES: methylated-DNA--[protein]-cysteine S-methyltransferase [Sphingomonas]MDF0488057.1 methylated-DNA--[protein]-cysteine S-methyltransferase [Sphingomonas pollutisoli]SDA33194.1 methylated-DNA-[protein]-cysteine S-methyltransferase [Sphingomonas sp. NFR15]